MRFLGYEVHDRDVTERHIVRVRTANGSPVLGADVLVYDAQFTPQELAEGRKGWGHSSWLEGTRIAKEAGAKQLILCHHDPDNDDAYVDGLVEKARQEFPHVAGAAEGMEFDLPGGMIEHAKFTEGFDRRRDRRYHIQMPLRVSVRGLKESPSSGRALRHSRINYFVTPADVEPDNRWSWVAGCELTHLTIVTRLSPSASIASTQRS
jgi:hypothetical protein